MSYPRRFWDGVERAGVAGCGLYGAYSLATSWGATTSISGAISGMCGVVLGGALGTFLGALAIPLVICLVAAAVEMVTGLGSELVHGLGNMFGCN